VLPGRPLRRGWLMPGGWLVPVGWLCGGWLVPVGWLLRGRSWLCGWDLGLRQRWLLPGRVLMRYPRSRRRGRLLGGRWLLRLPLLFGGLLACRWQLCGGQVRLGRLMSCLDVPVLSGLPALRGSWRWHARRLPGREQRDRRRGRFGDLRLRPHRHSHRGRRQRLPHWRRLW
jgi:hypothetical protein